MNAQTSTFRCASRRYLVSLIATDAMPECPRCTGGEFVRPSQLSESPKLVGDPVAEVEGRGWLGVLRGGLGEAAPYLAYRSPGDLLVAFALRRRWTRGGRGHPLR